MNRRDEPTFKNKTFTLKDVKAVQLIETSDRIKQVKLIQVDIAYGSGKNDVASWVVVAEAEDGVIEHVTLGSLSVDEER